MQVVNKYVYLNYFIFSQSADCKQVYIHYLKFCRCLHKSFKSCTVHYSSLSQDQLLKSTKGLTNLHV